MLWRQKALMSAWCIAFFLSIDDCLSCFLIVIVFLVCRIMSLAQDYCLRRSVFGKLLVDHPLHLQTLARMEVSVFLTRWICKTGKIQGFHSINWVEGKGNTELMVCSSLQAGSPLSDMPKCRTAKWSGIVKSGEQVPRKIKKVTFSSCRFTTGFSACGYAVFTCGAQMWVCLQVTVFLTRVNLFQSFFHPSNERLALYLSLSKILGLGDAPTDGSALIGSHLDCSRQKVNIFTQNKK